MTDEEIIRRSQVQHAAILEAAAASVRRAWLGLGSWNEADVARFTRLAQAAYEAAGTRVAALVDATTAQLANTRPIGVAARIAPTITNPRPLPAAEVWRRPFIEHWSNLSRGVDFQASLNSAVHRAETIAVQNTQMVMREAMAEVVRVHAVGADTIRPGSRIDPDALARFVDERDRLAQLTQVRPDLDVVAQQQAQLAELRMKAAEPMPSRQIVGYRRVLTGKSCMFCAAASTQIYGLPGLRREKLNDSNSVLLANGRRRRVIPQARQYGPASGLMPLHAHCDCSVAPVFIGWDPAYSLNAQVLSNLKSQGKGYWKQRGFVDNDGNPLDPTAVPDALGASVDHPEVGPVLAA